MKILLTGGAGFIGSHTLIELTEAGHEAVVVDNLDNSSPISLKRVAKIIGKEVPFYKVDIRDREGLQKVFDEHKFDACIHFAGLKAVGESCAKPLEYYENNMNGTSVTYDRDMANGKIGTPAKQAIEQEKRNRNEVNSIYYENIVREKKEYPQRGYNYSTGD